MKEKRLNLMSLMAKIFAVLVFLPLSLALVSCGDDDDDIPDDATLRTMLRNKWVITFENGQDRGVKCYVDLTGTVGKVAFQYTQEDCDALGLDPNAWYEGCQGNIQITDDNTWSTPGFVVMVGTYNVGLVFKEDIKETYIGNNTVLYTGPDVNIKPLPFIKSIEQMSGQWVSAGKYYKEIKNANSDKLYCTWKSFGKNSDGTYQYYGDVIGFRMKRIEGKFVTVQTTHDGDWVIELVDKDDMKVTDNKDVTRIYQRVKPSVTVNPL